jgi:two-component system sensor histidine kinase QseC
VDPHDLDQVLDVLIDNAITHAPGIIEISATSNGGIVTVSVRDQGPGIAPDDRSRVTERFFRGQGAPPGGSGLGLAIAHELAEQWGGGLRISAADGIGSRVEAWFPMVDSEHGRAEA